MRKTKEPYSTEPRKVGDIVKVKGRAHMVLLRKAGTLPEELSALSEREGNRRYHSKQSLDRNGKHRRGTDRKGTPTIAESEEELMLITEESELNLARDEMTWVVDSGASFHLTLDWKCFSSYSAGDHGCVRMEK